MQQRSLNDYLKLLLKGVMMGAADAVPGVSGGTVAFITGIYEELIHSIRRCDPMALQLLFKEGLQAFWVHINGNFLITLLAGIGLSLASLAHIVLYLLDTHPVLLWAFFFGLILSSVWSVARHVGVWGADTTLMFVFGTLVAYLITSLAPTSVEVTPVFIVISGMIAICAMILPGISGSFILLLLGMYSTILTAVKQFEIPTLGLFTFGCVLGLLSFSRVLSWAFSRYHALTLALLGGFLLGSLNKVWPWKYTLSYTLNSNGEQIPLVQQNISPNAYLDLTGADPQTLISVVLAIVGALLVLALDRQNAGVKR
ncbi:MAG TPA: DUF368 domain-containing protein [Marinobacterium sp.]|nr:DUF368 domain-containing protein [Marinobacterium sp.]